MLTSTRVVIFNGSLTAPLLWLSSPRVTEGELFILELCASPKIILSLFIGSKISLNDLDVCYLTGPWIPFLPLSLASGLPPELFFFILDTAKSVSEVLKFHNATKFLELLEEANLVQELNSHGDITVFSPSNRALEKIPQEEFEALKVKPFFILGMEGYH